MLKNMQIMHVCASIENCGGLVHNEYTNIFSFISCFNIIQYNTNMFRVKKGKYEYK